MPLTKNQLSLAIIVPVVAILWALAAVVTVINERDNTAEKKDEAIVQTPGLPLSENLTDIVENVMLAFNMTEEEVMEEQCVVLKFLNIEATLSTLDLANRMYRLKMKFTPCGNFVDNKVLSFGKGTVLGIPITFVFGEAILNKFVNGRPISTIEHTGYFDSGNINNYPMDVYVAEDLYASGTYINATTKEKQDVPMFIRVNSIVPGVVMRVTVLQDLKQTPEEGSSIQLNFTVSRARVTLFFSGLIMAIMWMLSLLAFSLAITLYIRGRKIEPPTIGFSVSMLFALPGLRNSQPGSPPIGCSSDVVSFFWAMAIASASASLLIANYIMSYNIKKDPPKK
ncbi:hypothetical protein HDU96_006260 [Phlyctochytrium bullatum]|nr:hypothetical protein HDU96_006260 [Phlyctochytrium bullatum]